MVMLIMSDLCTIFSLGEDIRLNNFIAFMSHQMLTHLPYLYIACLFALKTTEVDGGKY